MYRIVLCLSLYAMAAAAQATDARCDGAEGVRYICGPNNAEDLLRIPETRWVITGDMGDPDRARGGFYLIDTRDESWERLEASFAGPAARPYQDCPSPPDAEQFSVHGISLKEGAEGTHTLYAVNHGDRESIEIFELDTGASEPTLQWQGCVLLPDRLSANSVTHLPGESIAVTIWSSPGEPGALARAYAGKRTGFVLEWSPAGGWSHVPGSDTSGTNGILASDDGEWLYIAGWADGTVTRLSRNRLPYQRQVVDVGFLVDNLRYTPDGAILATGQDTTARHLLEACVRTDREVCEVDTVIVRVEPETMAVEEIARLEGNAGFGGGTAAIVVNGELWVGTFRSNRIAIIPTADRRPTEGAQP